mmetsp:Transcript_17152/g.56141  ORF Transcript_17152/g.56141 Transcript_17152/m.56141 type:complete len:258 (-) Transcript_17152:2728-3501(-)
MLFDGSEHGPEVLDGERLDAVPLKHKLVQKHVERGLLAVVLGILRVAQRFVLVRRNDELVQRLDCEVLDVLRLFREVLFELLGDALVLLDGLAGRLVEIHLFHSLSNLVVHLLRLLRLAVILVVAKGEMRPGIFIRPLLELALHARVDDFQGGAICADRNLDLRRTLLLVSDFRRVLSVQPWPLTVVFPLASSLLLVFLLILLFDPLAHPVVDAVLREQREQPCNLGFELPAPQRRLFELRSHAVKQIFGLFGLELL